MPLYDFECRECGRVTEGFFKIADCPGSIPCSCGAEAVKILSAGYGGIFSDTPGWLDDQVRGVLQDDDLIQKGKMKPIETRKELNRHLKEHNLAPVPAFREI